MTWTWMTLTVPLHTFSGTQARIQDFLKGGEDIDKHPPPPPPPWTLRYSRYCSLLLGIVTLIGPQPKGWNKILGMGNWGPPPDPPGYGPAIVTAKGNYFPNLLIISPHYKLNLGLHVCSKGNIMCVFCKVLLIPYFNFLREKYGDTEKWTSWMLGNFQTPPYKFSNSHLSTSRPMCNSFRFDSNQKMSRQAA